MNKQRRNKISKILNELEDVVIDEQKAFDNLPDWLHYAEKGEGMQENIS